MSPRRDYTLYDPTVPRVALRVLGGVALIGWLALLLLVLSQSFSSEEMEPYQAGALGFMFLIPLLLVSALGTLLAGIWWLPISHRRSDWVWAIVIASPILALLLGSILVRFVAG